MAHVSTLGALAHSYGAPESESSIARALHAHELAKGRIFAFDAVSPISVGCLIGELWVTGPGLDDRILTAGDSVRVTARGRVVVQALKASQFLVGAALH